MKPFIILLLITATHSFAGDYGQSVIRDPITRQQTAVATTSGASDHHTTTLRDPVTREARAVIQETPAGSIVRDPVSREIKTVISK